MWKKIFDLKYSVDFEWDDKFNVLLKGKIIVN